jgi:ABC-type antimicrobial peptide transport system permease subunit
MVARSAATQALWGGLAGILGAFLTGRLMQQLLFGVGPNDAATFIAAALLLGLVGVLATYVPARRAVSIEPMTALRSE